MLINKSDNCGGIKAKAFCILTFAWVLLVVLPSVVLADNSSRVKVQYGIANKIQISATGINRISLTPLMVNKIVGDLSEFTSLVSEDAGEIFLTSKKGAGEQMNCALILADGKVIDLILQVTELKHPKIIRLELESNSAEREYEEADKMLAHMQRGSAGKYYVQEIRKDYQLPGDNGIKLRQQQIYRFGNLYGSVLTATNKGKKYGVLKPEYLLQAFGNAVAVVVERQLLKPRAQTMAYVIFSEEEDV